MAALPYVLSPLLIVGFSCFTLWRNIEGGNWGNAAFAGFNTFASIWAIVSYIGIKNIFMDIWIGCTELLYVEATTSKSQQGPVTDQPRFNWKSVLYHGETDGSVPHAAVISKGKQIQAYASIEYGDDEQTSKATFLVAGIGCLVASCLYGLWNDARCE